MDTLLLSPLEYTESRFTHYEFPPEGISFLGSAVRRMHKTFMLCESESLIGEGCFEKALHHLSNYVIASATSYGSMLYEPEMDTLGSTITEEDPDTGAIVTATLINDDPDVHCALGIRMSSGSYFIGTERANKSNYSMRGLTIPAEVVYDFVSADQSYQAHFTGTIQREIVPRLVGPWYIRATGELSMSDNMGNRGCATLDRNAKVKTEVDYGVGRFRREFQLA